MSALFSFERLKKYPKKARDLLPGADLPLTDQLPSRRISFAERRRQ